MNNSCRYILFLFAFFLGGCASSIPKNINSTPEPNLSYEEFRIGGSKYMDKSVRWGGEIIAVENEENHSMVEILSHELGRRGRPLEQDEYQGRFIARVNEFLDPEYYKKGRQLTVYGTLTREIEKDISAHTYSYPVIDVEQYYLWPDYTRLERGYMPPAHFYPYHLRSPFMHPFYGHPYWYPYYW